MEEQKIPHIFYESVIKDDAEVFGTFDPGDGRQLKVISQSKGKDAPAGYAHLPLFPEAEQKRRELLELSLDIQADNRNPGELAKKINLFNNDMEIAASIHETFLKAKEDMIPVDALVFHLPQTDQEMNLKELLRWTNEHCTNHRENYPAIEKLAFKDYESAVHLMLEQDIADTYIARLAPSKPE